MSATHLCIDLKFIIAKNPPYWLPKLAEITQRDGQAWQKLGRPYIPPAVMTNPLPIVMFTIGTADKIETYPVLCQN